MMFFSRCIMFLLFLAQKKNSRGHAFSLSIVLSLLLTAMAARVGSNFLPVSYLLWPISMCAFVCAFVVVLVVVVVLVRLVFRRVSLSLCIDIFLYEHSSEKYFWLATIWRLFDTSMVVTLVPLLHSISSPSVLFLCRRCILCPSLLLIIARVYSLPAFCFDRWDPTAKWTSLLCEFVFFLLPWRLVDWREANQSTPQGPIELMASRHPPLGPLPSNDNSVPAAQEEGALVVVDPGLLLFNYLKLFLILQWLLKIIARDVQF